MVQDGRAGEEESGRDIRIRGGGGEAVLCMCVQVHPNTAAVLTVVSPYHIPSLVQFPVSQKLARPDSHNRLDSGPDLPCHFVQWVGGMGHVY